MNVLTNSEKLLLSSVAAFALSLTGIVMFCLCRKNCWLHKALWQDDEKTKRRKMSDVICIRYPPDMYPTSLGIYRESNIRSPEEELARMFYSPLNKRDSTYSSMSETSSGGFDFSSPGAGSSGSNATTSPINNNNTMVSPPSENVHNNNQSSTTIPPPQFPLPVVTLPPDHRRTSMPMPHGMTAMTMTMGLGMGHPTPRTTASMIAAEAAVAANQRFSQNNSAIFPNQPQFKQPFFTFILKYCAETSLIHIEFIEARNLPQKEYLNAPSDPFFTIEVQPKKPLDRKREMIRYRFVTKIIKKAGEVCTYNETFLVQLAKNMLKEYIIRFSAFDQDKYGNPTEVGSTELAFDDFRDFSLSKLVLSCSLKEPVLKRGDLMIGMCYLPTAERISVTVSKLNNLHHIVNEGVINKQSVCYVRLLLLRAENGKMIRRRKTTFQKVTGGGLHQPVFNETLVFDMPPTELLQTVLLVLVCITDKQPVVGSKYSIEEEEEAVEQQMKRPPQNTHHHRLQDDSLLYNSRHFTKASRTNSSDSEGSRLSKGSSSGVSSSKENEIGSSDPPPELAKSHRQSIKDSVVGKVALGYHVKNPLGKMHWENMIRAPRNIMTEWHNLK